MNSIPEIIHKVIANFVHKLDLQHNYLDGDDPWSGILADEDFVVLNTHHTTLKATPGQLVFECDMILHTSFIGYSEAIRRSNQKLIDKKLGKKRKTAHIYNKG